MQPISRGNGRGIRNRGAGPWTSCLSFCKGICNRDEVEIDASVDVTYTRKTIWAEVFYHYW